VSYQLNPKGPSVFGHQYVNELGNAAVWLTHWRVAGAFLQSGVISMYTAKRYYLGSREGYLAQARRCFVHSLRTNALFVKSWKVLRFRCANARRVDHRGPGFQ
jgi:hypothetical protein